MPSKTAATGIAAAVLDDLVLRRLLIERRLPTNDLAAALHIATSVAEDLVRGLRDRRLVETDGLNGRNLVAQLTEHGLGIATQRNVHCRYAGAAPVGMADYAAVVRAQRPDLSLDRASLSRVMSDLVLPGDLLDQLGPAIHSDGAIFLHGPPGTGKTAIAQRVIRAFDDVVLIPYAVLVEGQIVTVFDPAVHTPVAAQPPGMDPRWVACDRPAVIVGGELRAGMLDLEYDDTSGTFVAPIQMKANDGVLVVDDFGRQAMPAEALLNRWIVPLDRHVDYLTLVGRKIEVPFVVKVVFSTNYRPEQLGDEAFFRRIHNKVFVGSVTDRDFDWILDRVARSRGFEVTVDGAARLRDQARRRGEQELRAYLPGVVCAQANALCRFDGSPKVLTAALVDRALDLYFSTDW